MGANFWKQENTRISKWGSRIESWARKSKCNCSWCEKTFHRPLHHGKVAIARRGKKMRVSHTSAIPPTLNRGTGQLDSESLKKTTKSPNYRRLLAARQSSEVMHLRLLARAAYLPTTWHTSGLEPNLHRTQTQALWGLVEGVRIHRDWANHKLHHAHARKN